jgi:hypothetical protein
VDATQMKIARKREAGMFVARDGCTLSEKRHDD